jgi:hypothetical protein
MTEHNFVRGKCACGATEATRPGTTGRPESGCQHADTSTYIEPATCFISGYKVVTCKTCNTVVERETLKATGHTEKTDVWIEDCSIATIIIQLAAEELGLGSCWVQVRNRKDANGVLSVDCVKSLLDIPANYAVLSIVGIGHKARATQPFDEEKMQWEKIHIGNFGGK